ncbi:hypothetical protein RclHR1_00900029 [Rhizophagus clarus]|uniref:Protein kinase domain-containing protein n=1 Tax=Rhizophagus clarus TaxID=94130 RepID=A0A2Z6S937_9GLOM|nr:hypothetical protein RclHR1_00900029 [Rhizophagus clarus]
MTYQDNDDRCKKCEEKYMNKYDAKYKWCKSCQINNLKQNFTNWTSGNKSIDNLIQEIQLKINELDDMIFEWIAYDQFKEISEEGFDDKVHSAIWKDGPLDYDKYQNEYTRNQENTKVALKSYNLQNIINEFFIDEGKKHSLKYIIEVLKMYGITQCPNTKDYIIVFQEIYCKICGKKYTNINEEWCEPCQINYFKNTFTSSGNDKIDNIIQEIQSKITYKSEIVLEWIPYNQLKNIRKMNKLSKNDLYTMYSATWKDGPLCYNDSKWKRISNKTVNLKYLHDSQKDIIKFLNKIKNYYSLYKCCDIYGISENPDTKEFIMVFPNIYCKKCKNRFKRKVLKRIDDANNEWCKSCQIDNLKQNFTNWTSKNEKLDSLIQEMQLEINKLDDIIIEWIPYNNIKEISKEGYSAIWKDGPLNYDKMKNEYTRNQQNTKITLKLYNSQNITSEFLNEVKNDLNKYRGKTFGISQNIDTNNYIMILQNDYIEICEKCGEIIDYEWCRSCHINYVRKLFIDWSSENEIIDNLIRKRQSKINDSDDVIFEFISYNQFNNIKEINKNDLTTVYSAIWNDGPLLFYDMKWTRESNKKVFLKLFSLQNTNEFLNEVKKYLTKNGNSIYGISLNQDIKCYVIVFKFKLYCEKCNEEFTNYNIEYEWCKKCRVNDLKQNFINWTSDNEEIDNLIQEMQLEIDNPYGTIFEWIPFNQFSNIKKECDDNFIKIYSAIWNDDFLYYDHLYLKNQEQRSNLRVTLNYSFSDDIEEIIDKVKEYSVSKKYGISQDPNTKEYIIVFENDYCEKCDEEYTDTHNKWCKPCQLDYLAKIIPYWTIEDIEIEYLIEDIQFKINYPYDIIFEWIPYNQFSNIKEIGKGGFATVYSAIWKNGPLLYNGYEYSRDQKQVALKQLECSHNVIAKFLNEANRYSVSEYNEILLIYGLTQNPDTKNYVMVLDYAEGGNLYNWINKHYNKLDWSYNINVLLNIIEGLNEIHEKDMIHRDFHTGNILLMSTSLNDDISIVISDMGFCGKVSKSDKTEVYGVMPYVAPEILRGNRYTCATDIYSFGMIMYVIATGRQPFGNRAHDETLALDICCEGIRPNINDQEAPECYIDLMKRCWDSNSDNRPDSTEIIELIRLFRDSYIDSDFFEREEQHYDIEKQFKKADEYKESNFLILEERRQSATHSQAVYTSRLLNPFTKDLPKYGFDSECLDCEI